MADAMSLLLFFGVTFALPLALARWSRYCAKVALGWDCLGSALLPGGEPGESLSGRAGSAQRQGHLRGRICAPVINFIMGKKDHCLRAIAGDILRAQAVIKDQQQ